MGNGYKQKYNTYHHHHQNLHFHHKTTFLPLLCSRPVIKDVTIPKLEDPLSPKIGCMGQVKRNNKIAGLIPAAATYNKLNAPATAGKSFKLKRFFSSKNLTAATLTAPATTTACTRRRELGSKNNIINGEAGLKKANNDNCVPVVNIVDLDPPLPVIKRDSISNSNNKGQEETIWKRRSGGAALTSLQLQHIQLNTRLLDQPTTV